jgi:hypothetical protein
MTLNYDDIAGCVELHDLDPDDVILTDYTGRGMHGDICFAFRLDDLADAFHILLYINEAGIDAHQLADRLAMDSMGRSTLVYFPGVNLDGAPDDDTEDEDDE